MKYFSTNRNQPSGYTATHSFKEALLMGIAPDAGLFMPENLPHFSADTLDSWRGKSYAAIATEVLYPFVKEDISKETLYEIAQEAYDFDIPLEQVHGRVFVARLDQGPTASFKDFAARFMARMMRYFLENQPLTLLVATSGDTGSAVGAAFKGMQGVKVYILYPTKEVSTVQEQQLTRINDNVTAIAIDGKFDDCQQLVKQAFADQELQCLHLSSANSINVGRVLPQMVYYFYLWLKISEKSTDKVNFVVPSGNLGNSLGALLARQMGLPIHRLLVATNTNDSVPTFLKSGIYKKIEPSREAISNAMNVGNPSNLARYFDIFGGNIDKNGHVHQLPNLAAMREQIFSESIDDATTIATIKHYHENYGCLLEPHGAVGAAAYERLKNDLDSHATVILETAHPAKFPETIQETLGLSPETPLAMQNTLKNASRSVPLSKNFGELKAFLLADNQGILKK